MIWADEGPRYEAIAAKYPDEVGIVGESVNEYGTPVSVGRCFECGGVFTVCPVIKPERRPQWLGCLAEGCPSYDPDRDVDLFFEPMADHGLIRREATS